MAEVSGVEDPGMATMTISSKTYSAWSLRGWLLTRLAGLPVTELPVERDANDRAELLLLSPSVRVPRLTHEGVSVWDTLSIAEYLNERFPEARMLPADKVARVLPDSRGVGANGLVDAGGAGRG